MDYRLNGVVLLAVSLKVLWWFIPYISDFPEIVKSHFKQFADDAMKIKKNNDFEDFYDI